MVAGTAESSLLRDWLRARRALAISATAWAEFQSGPVTELVVSMTAQLVGEPIPFTVAEARLAATLFNQTGRRRGSLLDCMIAAAAIESGDELATVNHADFKRFLKFGLQII